MLESNPIDLDVMDDLGRMAEAARSIALYLRNLGEKEAALPCAPALAGAEATQKALEHLIEAVNAFSTAETEPDPAEEVIKALREFLPAVFAAAGVDCESVNVTLQD